MAHISSPSPKTHTIKYIDMRSALDHLAARVMLIFWPYGIVDLSHSLNPRFFRFILIPISNMYTARGNRSYWGLKYNIQKVQHSLCFWGNLLWNLHLCSGSQGKGIIPIVTDINESWHLYITVRHFHPIHIKYYPLFEVCTCFQWLVNWKLWLLFIMNIVCWSCTDRSRSPGF